MGRCAAPAAPHTFRSGFGASPTGWLSRGPQAHGIWVLPGTYYLPERGLGEPRRLGRRGREGVAGRLAPESGSSCRRHPSGRALRENIVPALGPAGPLPPASAGALWVPRAARGERCRGARHRDGQLAPTAAGGQPSLRRSPKRSLWG